MCQSVQAETEICLFWQYIFLYFPDRYRTSLESTFQKYFATIKDIEAKNQNTPEFQSLFHFISFIV
jgi:hypothetical protein